MCKGGEGCGKWKTRIIQVSVHGDNGNLFILFFLVSIVALSRHLSCLESMATLQLVVQSMRFGCNPTCHSHLL
jgi:hypothetical protein